MKRASYRVFAFLIVLALVSMGLKPAEKGKNDNSAGLQKTLNRGDFVKFDANNISTFIRNNGSFNRDPGTGNSGFEWPKGTGNTANYASGIWLGGKKSNDIRIAIAEYAYEFDAGPIAAGVNPLDARWKVYKIKRGDDATNNPDYANWPVADGAPVDALGKPLLIGDMTIWCVFNDNNQLLHTNINTAPLGIEVQLTAFAFNRSDALGNTIFYKWKLINKGGAQIDSAYVTVWTDIDLGDSGDDYDGCDTTLGIGFTYNDGVDGVYGNAPATGFDFLQGPRVPGAPTDTARYPDGRIFPGKKLLKMTSFLKYSNDATDLGNPNTGQEVFNYMKGLTRTGVGILNSANQPSTFMFSGDPNVAAGPTNWIETGASGDRRFMMSAGPFTMAAGDTQEIVAGNLIAQGASSAGSVTAIKNADKAVQLAYDLDFKLPPPPPAPAVVAAALDKSVVLSWGENDVLATSIENTVTTDGLAQAAGATDFTYNFEGYVVYQFGNASGDDPKIVATYDVKVNPEDPAIPSPGVISDDVFDPSLGSLVNKPVKFGGNSGVVRSIKISTDKYTNLPLVNGKDYYFAVTSYSYSKESVPKTLESSISVKTVRPTMAPGARLLSNYADTLRTAVVHTTGVSEAQIIPRVVDPSLLTGHSYRITIDVTGPEQKWKLRDATTSTDLLTSTNFGPGQGGNTYSWPIKDGIEWGVYDVETRPNPVASTFVGGTWIQSIRYSNVPPAVIDPTHNGAGIITPSFDLPNFLGAMAPVFNPKNATPVEVRFGPGETQNGYRMQRAGGVGTAYVIQDVNPFVPVPFTVWDMTNPATPRQLTFSWRDQDGSATYNPAEDDDALELGFIYFKTYDPAGNQFLYRNAAGHVAADWSNAATVGANADIMYGMSFGLVAGHTLGETASKLVITPFKVLQPNEVYTIAGPAAPSKSAAISVADIANIKAVPNPYFGANAYEKNQFNRVIRFTNLPRQATIRIFNIAGEVIRVIDKNGPETTADWDLTNKSDLPVASGMYLVYIDLPGIGTKTLKVAVITSEERLDNF